MNKLKASVWMAVITVTAAALMMAVPALRRRTQPTEQTAAVQLCQVELGGIEQVTAVMGVVRYQGECAAVSPATGIVRAVYVAAGDRVTAGQPLFRLDGAVQEQVISAAIARQQEEITIPTLGYGMDLSGVKQAAAWETTSAMTEAALALEGLTVRAAADGLVQQVLVAENGGIAAGSVGVALSSEQQQIQCMAVLKDAQQLCTGMQARILSDGETLCIGTVVGIGEAVSSNGQTVCQVDLQPETMLSLPLGAQVDVEIIRCSAEQVPVLPVAAVSAEDTVRWIADERSYETSVSVLMSDENHCWVDLPVGTQVILAGEATMNGQRIREAGQ